MSSNKITVRKMPGYSGGMWEINCPLGDVPQHLRYWRFWVFAIDWAQQHGRSHGTG